MPKDKAKDFQEDPPRPREDAGDPAPELPGVGHNSGDEELAEMIEEWCDLQEKEDALIELHLKDIRAEKAEVKRNAEEKYDIKVRAFNARAGLRMIERQDAPEVVLATNRLFKALPVGANMDMLVVQAEADKIKADKQAAKDAKAAERAAAKEAKKSAAKNEEVET